MNNFTFEKKKLLSHLANPDLIALLKSAKCFIAGGAITSLFSGKDINDVDVYFRDYESLMIVLKNLFNHSDMDDFEFRDISSFTLVYTNLTKKSILFTKDGLNLQLIYFKFFNTPQDIFDTFDFSVNMGAFDCANEEFVFSENFIKDIAQRKLTVNPKTAFPIISLLRIDKYKQRGYRISRKDFINLCLAVNKLEIKTWENVSEAIGGMYGYSYTDVFDTTKEFSIDESINQLIKLEANLEDYSSMPPSSVNFYELEDQIKINLKIPQKPEDRIFYKKVLRTDAPDVFTSYYYQSFKYKVNDIANGGDLGIWAYSSTVLAAKHFASGDKSKEAIISLKALDGTKILRENKTSLKIIGDFQVIGEVTCD